MVKLIGYWCSKVDPKKSFHVDPKLERYLDKNMWEPYIEEDQYPWPGSLIDPKFWIDKDKKKVIDYLKSGVPCNRYRGFSSCRLCGEILGTPERTDGVWCWPDKFEHYIEAHNICIPIEFLSWIFEKGIVDTTKDFGRFIKFDDSFWIEWGKNHGLSVHNTDPIHSSG